ncbi:hypothetical protein LG52_1145 [Geobacillus kaustophilus]|uniref:DUF502 domain-containing protein n=1 Tax=Geobacillus kaustophilus TaxID=1462 RepID=A0A0D8BTI6_GEOKU|nr:DUF502 domain-containing protein [Geobacillus kaustophilus]KJE27284.1 hypothetical protein LG52_1145 [Geobacillus kaustophilus]
MRFFVKHFLNGMLTIVPILLAVYVCYKVFTVLDGLLGQYVRPYLDGRYIPGLGLLATVALITVCGWLSTQYVSGRLIRLIDRLLESIPLMKTVYSVAKDTIASFVGEKRSFSQVVLVTVPESGWKCLGFMTMDDVGAWHDPLADYVAVYIPQAFQVAGLTLLVPKEQVEVVDISPEEAMKFILSGGVAVRKQKRLPQ